MNKIIVANQKAYLTREGVQSFLNEFAGGEVIFCPSFPFLCLFNNHILGGQDIAASSELSATGEVTADQLKSLNCTYAIIGHSERRKFQKEDNEITNQKLLTTLNAGMTPILCVGETHEEYDLGLTRGVVKMQLDASLANANGEVIIAYEPVWAIGSGLTPTNEEIDDVVNFIKELYPSYKVLYGGSVKASNIAKLNEIHSVDGYLIGGASSKADELNEIVKSCQ